MVGLDLVFDQPDEGDDRLADAVARHADRVVLAYDLGFAELQAGPGGLKKRLIYPPPEVLRLTEEAWQRPHEDGRLGFINFQPGDDGRVRAAQLILDSEGQRHISFAGRILQRAGLEEVLPPEPDSRLIHFAGAPGEAFSAGPPRRNVISIADVFIPSLWQNNLRGGEVFRDALVVVGPAARVFHDFHQTPFHDRMLGPELHLQTINAGLQGAWLTESNASLRWGIIGGAAAVVWLGLVFLRLPLAKTVFVAGLGGTWLLLSFELFNREGHYLLTFFPVALVLGSGSAGLVYDYWLERRERLRLRSTLERYVSRNLVRQILDHPEDYMAALGGTRRFVTTFFSDVRGFTTLTEQADSHALVAQLNEYFSAMVACVFRHGGTLDKFIGDAIMAVWGNVTTGGPEADAREAVRACLEMRKELNWLNEGWAAAGRGILHVGMGLNSGEAIVGNMGSPEKMEFTVIGDAVNVASRLEGVTKDYKIGLALGEETASLLDDSFVLLPVDLLVVKGKTRPVEVFTVLGLREELAPAEVAWAEDYCRAMSMFRAKQFSEAAAVWQSCEERVPGDSLVQLYLARCEDLIEHPPPPDWDGVVLRTTK